MEWSELKEEAKKIGGYCLEYINFKFGNVNVWFSKDGSFSVSYIGGSSSCNITIKSNVSYDQMLAIMKALQ